MGKYAENTTLPVERSRSELERVLRNRGARRLVNYTETDTGFASVQFEVENRLVRFTVVVPPMERYSRDKYGFRRSDAQIRNAWAQEERRRWRVLILTIKAKLEEVENELSTFDEAFLPYIVLPNNTTVAETMLPAIDESYRTGVMPSLDAVFRPGLPAPQHALPAPERD